MDNTESETLEQIADYISKYCMDYVENATNMIQTTASLPLKKSVDSTTINPDIERVMNVKRQDNEVDNRENYNNTCKLIFGESYEELQQQYGVSNNTRGYTLSLISSVSNAPLSSVSHTLLASDAPLARVSHAPLANARHIMDNSDSETLEQIADYISKYCCKDSEENSTNIIQPAASLPLKKSVDSTNINPDKERVITLKSPDNDVDNRENYNDTCKLIFGESYEELQHQYGVSNNTRGHTLSVSNAPLSSVSHTLLASVSHAPLASISHAPLASVSHASLASARYSPLAGARHATLASARHSPLASARYSSFAGARHSPLARARHAPLASARHAPLASARHTPLDHLISCDQHHIFLPYVSHQHSSAGRYEHYSVTKKEPNDERSLKFLFIKNKKVDLPHDQFSVSGRAHPEIDKQKTNGQFACNLSPELTAVAENVPAASVINGDEALVEVQATNRITSRPAHKAYPYPHCPKSYVSGKCLNRHIPHVNEE